MGRAGSGAASDTTIPGGLQAVQMVGNMEPAAGRAKEAWLAPLLPALQQGIAQMKDFIARLVGMEEEEEEEEGEGRPPGPSAAVVKEGPLVIHKTRGKGPLLAATAKKLHFCLTGEALSFGKSPGAEVGGCWGVVGAGSEVALVSCPPNTHTISVSAPSPWPTSSLRRRWRRRASGAPTSCRWSTWTRAGGRRQPTSSARWEGDGGRGGHPEGRRSLGRPRRHCAVPRSASTS